MTRISAIGMFSLLMLSLTACQRTASGQVQEVAVSPDGTLVALAYRKDNTCFIYKVPLNTGTATRLTRAETGRELSPAFSMDGKLIAYSYDAGKSQSRVRVVNADGSNGRSFATSEGDDSYPIFSPNGTKIYFASSRYFGSYSPIATPHEHEWDFFSADLDGKNIRQLTTQSYYLVSKPSVSPDGKQLMFKVERYRTGSQFEIHSLEQPAKPTVLLQPHVPGESRMGPVAEDPQFLPDGKSIMFMAASDGKSGYDYDVYRMTLATGALEKLTGANGYSTGLAISADGGTAIFLKWKLDWHKTPVSSELYSLDLQTHSVRPVKITGLN
jgi:Tol biopolymer transport system component